MESWLILQQKEAFDSVKHYEAGAFGESLHGSTTGGEVVDELRLERM